MRVRVALGVACLVLFSCAARGDTFSYPLSGLYTYSLQGTFASGATLSGIFQVQFIADRNIVSNADEAVQNGSASTKYLAPDPQGNKYISSVYATDSSGSLRLSLNFSRYPITYVFGSPDPGDFQVANSIDACVRSALCTSNAGGPPAPGSVTSGVYALTPGGSIVLQDELVSGRAVLVTTPEPSSLALLGTGVLGVAGLLRRRSA